MTLTVFAMTVLIVWAIRNICNDLGLKDIIKEKANKKKED